MVRVLKIDSIRRDILLDIIKQAEQVSYPYKWMEQDQLWEMLGEYQKQFDYTFFHYFLDAVGCQRFEVVTPVVAYPGSGVTRESYLQDLQNISKDIHKNMFVYYK